MVDWRKALQAVAPERAAAWLFGSPPAFSALVAAELADASADCVRLCGYLAYYRAFSLFRDSNVLLIENLYIDQAARGRRIAVRLLSAAARKTRSLGYERMELNVTAHNRRAIEVYENLGFFAPGEMVYRIEGENLTRLADRAS